MPRQAGSAVASQQAHRACSPAAKGRRRGPFLFREAPPGDCSCARRFLVAGSESGRSEDEGSGPTGAEGSGSAGAAGQGSGQGGGAGGAASKARRRRTAFTSEQLLELEREFHAKKYLSLTERSHIAHALKLSEVQVRL